MRSLTAESTSAGELLKNFSVLGELAQGVRPGSGSLITGIEEYIIIKQSVCANKYAALEITCDELTMTMAMTVAMEVLNQDI